jgi:hypothetical protein
MRTILDQTDVIIAGLGPTGATLAGLLGQRGVPGRVLPSSRSSGVITANSGRAGRVDQLGAVGDVLDVRRGRRGPGPAGGDLPAETRSGAAGVERADSAQESRRSRRSLRDDPARKDSTSQARSSNRAPGGPELFAADGARLRVRSAGLCRWLRDEDVQLARVTAAALLRLPVACRQAANCRISRHARCYSQHSPLARSSSPGY